MLVFKDIYHFYFKIQTKYAFVIVVYLLSHIQLFGTPWTVASLVPQSMGSSRQAYWSGLPFPPPWDLPDPGFEPTSPTFPALAGIFFTTEPPGKPKCASK